MSRMNFNQGQEIIRSDLNKIGKHMQRELYDRVIAELIGNTSDGFFGSGFKVTYVNGTTVAVAAGNGFQTDNTQVSPEPKKRPLYRAASGNKTLTTPDATNPRIDIVCVKAQVNDETTETRRYKATTASLPTDTDFVTEHDWESDVIVTAGTPAGSPVAPATPAGYIKIATLAVAATSGLASQASITDNRAILSAQGNIQVDTSAFLRVATKAAGTVLTTVLSDLDSALNTETIRGGDKLSRAWDAVVGSGSGCTHATLALALAAASAGWRILVTESATVNTTITCSLANVEIQFKNGVVYTNGTAGTGLTLNAADITVRGGKFASFTTAISVGASASGLMLRDIRFSSNTADIDDSNELADVLGCV